MTESSEKHESSVEANSPQSLAHPFGFKNYRKGTRPWFPFLPMIDFCAIACLLLLLSREFIFSPGISIDLPQAKPTNISGLNAMGVLTVLSGNGSDKILFNGYMRNLHDPGLLHALQKFDQRFEPSPTYLLVKMDNKTTNQTLQDLAHIARSAGIERLHIAVEVKK